MQWLFLVGMLVKNWAVIDDGIVHSRLHGAEEVVVHVGYVDGLMNDKDDGLARGRRILGECGSDDLEFAASGGWIISRDVHNLARTGDRHGFGSNAGSVIVRIQFECCLVCRGGGNRNLVRPLLVSAL